MLGVAASSVLMAGIAMAHEGGTANDAYVGDTNKHYITDSQGRCVLTSEWSKELATKECNPELFPEVTEAPPPPPPPPVVFTKHTLSATARLIFCAACCRQQAIHDIDEEIGPARLGVIDINVVGHTDSVGTEEYNQQLSLRRANAARTTWS
jgi:OOP family OmpA-OmpF porin